jgi:hypothetical protein
MIIFNSKYVLLPGATGYSIRVNLTWIAGIFEMERIYYTSRLRITTEYAAITARLIYDGVSIEMLDIHVTDGITNPDILKKLHTFSKY